jgi:hypothetical protein
VSNRIIVESKNDKLFIQSLVNYLNIHNIEILEINLSDNDYMTLGGLSLSSLKGELGDIKAAAENNNISKVGIILDADNSQAEKLDLINNAIKSIFPQLQQDKLERINNFIDISFVASDQKLFSLQIACYFVNINGTGELETLLKSIKSQPSPYADCLESWKICVEKLSESISQKDFDKFWVSNYLRFDTCIGDENDQAGKKCSMSGFDYVMANKLHIWDFEHPALDELKVFLKMFD